MEQSAAGPSRQPDPATPQPRRSNDRHAAATTPTLTHKTSMLSATDTFASATDGEGYYTDAADISAYHTDDARSRFDSVPHTIHAHGLDETQDGERLSRTSSNQTARRGDASMSAVHPPQSGKQLPPPESTATSASTPSPNASQTTQHAASAEEAGKQIEPGHQPPARHHRLLRHGAVLGLLMFTAIWGTLIREGLVALNTYDGESVTPLVWAQAVGCLIMGLAIGANRKPIEGRYPPAYIMITTGLCGSITTFSKWILDVFRAFGDQRHFHRGGLHNVMDALSQTAVTLGMSLVSVAAGVALSKVVNIELLIKAVQRRQSANNSLPSSSNKVIGDGSKSSKASMVEPGSTLVLDSSMLLLGIVFWIGSVLLCALYSPFRNVTFGLILAPPATILRWYLSRFNTYPLSKRLSLPLGTLAANMIATAVICAAFTASRAGSRPKSFAGGLTGCEALQGLEDGFCGCLSTISTFAVELRTIKPARKAVRYAVISWVSGVLICVLLVGVPWWNVGMDGRCLGYTS